MYGAALYSKVLDIRIVLYIIMPFKCVTNWMSYVCELYAMQTL